MTLRADPSKKLIALRHDLDIVERFGVTGPGSTTRCGNTCERNDLETTEAALDAGAVGNPYVKASIEGSLEGRIRR